MGQKFKNGETLKDILSAWLPALVAFVLIPVSVFLPNQWEFEYDLRILAPYLGMAVASVILLALLFRRLTPQRRGRVAVILFFFGVYLALSDTLAPVQLGEMRGTASLERVPEPGSRDLLDIAVGILTLACAVFVPTRLVRMAGPVVVAALLMSEVIVAWRGLEATRRQSELEARMLAAPAVQAEGGNVYHVTFDGFSSLNFLEIMQRIASPDDFEGFTCYSETRANYLQTYVSVPSYTTGRFYEGGSLGKWIRGADGEHLMANMRRAGYEVWQYVASRSWIHNAASHVLLAREFRGKDFAEECYFADLVVLHLAPHYLHQEVFGVGSRGLVSRVLGRWVPTSKLKAEPFRHVALYRKLIEDESRRAPRGQYVYAHLFIPHPPYVLMPDCTFSADATYEDQAGAAITLMLELIAEIKRAGNYEDSLILFHADHGDGTVGFQSIEDHGVTGEIGTRFKEIGLRERFVPWQVLNATRPLLLIKPPHASGLFTVDSEHLAQLADIPATIYELLDIDAETEVGQSILSAPSDRTVQVYRGFSKANEFGVNMRYGVRIFEGYANHFSYSFQNGWQIHDDIAVQW